jgi:hypothetical protein
MLLKRGGTGVPVDEREVQRPRRPLADRGPIPVLSRAPPGSPSALLDRRHSLMEHC